MSRACLLTNCRICMLVSLTHFSSAHIENGDIQNKIRSHRFAHIVARTKSSLLYLFCCCRCFCTVVCHHFWSYFDADMVFFNHHEPWHFFKSDTSKHIDECTKKRKNSKTGVKNEIKYYRKFNINMIQWNKKVKQKFKRAYKRWMEQCIRKIEYLAVRLSRWKIVIEN